MSNKALIGITIFSLFLIFTSLYLMKTLDQGQKSKPITSTIINMNPDNTKISDNFTLESENGHPFTYGNLENKFTLMYFGFSSCPDVCPITVQKLSEAADLLDKELSNKTQFIFVSVDPERDDLNALKEFTNQFNNKIEGITGTKNEIDKLASSLKVYYSADKQNTEANYYVDHSSFIYLLNPEVKLICQFTHDASAQEIAQQLKNIIDGSKN